MENIDNLISKTIKLGADKKYKEIISLLPETLLKKSNSDELYAQKGSALFGVKKIKLGKRTIDKSLAINPLNLKALMSLASMLYIDNNIDEAAKLCEKILEVDSKYWKAYSLLGSICLIKEKNQEAIEYYQKAIDIEPNDANPRSGLGAALVILKKSEEGIKELQTAIKLDPKDGYAHYTLGREYFDTNVYSRAKYHMQKYISLEPKEPFGYHLLGCLFLLEQNDTDAIKYFKKVLKTNPDFIESYEHLGNLFLKSKQFQKAEAVFQKAIKINSNSPIGFFGLGELNYQKRLYKDSAINFKKGVALCVPPNAIFIPRIKATARLLEIEKVETVPLYREMREIVDQIKKALLFKGTRLTHYTSLSVMKALIFEKSPLRISEASFLNDTSEGQEIFRYLDVEFIKFSDKNVISKPFATKPFVGSFVPNSKNDDLALWRMYGKESLEEAKGCSLTLDLKVFTSNLQRKFGVFKPEKLKEENKFVIRVMNTIEEFNFYRVAYRVGSNPGEFIIPDQKQHEKRFNTFMKDLLKTIDIFKKDEDRKDGHHIYELLNEIAYLFKSAEYEYEKEIRLVVNGDRFKKVCNFHPKVFIELVPAIGLIDSITIGPKVEKPEEWAASFWYNMDYEGYAPSITISRLPFK